MSPDPLFLQSTTDRTYTYPAEDFRFLIKTLITEGVLDVGNGDLRVTAGSGLTVSVAGGAASIQGDTYAGQGNYLARWQGSTTVTIGGAPASNTRIDLVVARIRDIYADNTAQGGQFLEVVPGAASTTPTAPTLPPGSIALAEVRVTTGQTTVTAANITDRRTQASANTLRVGTQAEPLTDAQIVALSGAAAFPGRLALSTDSGWLEAFGPDGVARGLTAGLFGDASDGDATITGTLTLTRAMHYRNLTLGASAVIETNGHKLYVRDVLNMTAGSVIRNNATSSAAGVSASGPGASLGVGGDGGYGGYSGGTTAPAPGSNASASSIALARALSNALAYTLVGGARGSTGGSSADNQGGSVAGIAGTGGYGGGVVVVLARVVVGTGTIEAAGGVGVAGQAGSSSFRGGSGGGGGGGGGVFVVTTALLPASITVRAPGGAGGAGGAAAYGAGGAGNPGASGLVVVTPLTA